MKGMWTLGSCRTRLAEYLVQGTHHNLGPCFYQTSCVWTTCNGTSGICSGEESMWGTSTNSSSLDLFWRIFKRCSGRSSDVHWFFPHNLWIFSFFFFFCWDKCIGLPRPDAAYNHVLNNLEERKLWVYTSPITCCAPLPQEPVWTQPRQNGTFSAELLGKFRSTGYCELW